MRSALVASLTLTTLLLSGCSTLKSLHNFNRTPAPATIDETPANPAMTKPANASASTGKLGIAISQTEPAELESITFFTKTPFAKEASDACVQEYLSAPENDDHIKYLGQDALTTSGSVSGEDRSLGILYGGHHIDFHLALLGQHNGTHYGFSQLRLAKQDKLNISNHDLRPILANSGDSKRVYQTLEGLFKQIDACVAENKAAE